VDTEEFKTITNIIEDLFIFLKLHVQVDAIVKRPQAAVAYVMVLENETWTGDFS